MFANNVEEWSICRAALRWWRPFTRREEVMRRLLWEGTSWLLEVAKETRGSIWVDMPPLSN